MASKKNVTLVRLVISALWPTDERLVEKLGDANDTNFHKLCREGVRSDRINTHFSGANTISNDSMNEYVDAIEALSAYHNDDPVTSFYSHYPNSLKGRENLKLRLFGSSGLRKSGRAIEGTEKDRNLEWLFPEPEVEIGA